MPISENPTQEVLSEKETLDRLNADLVAAKAFEGGIDVTKIQADIDAISSPQVNNSGSDNLSKEDKAILAGFQ